MGFGTTTSAAASLVAAVSEIRKTSSEELEPKKFLLVQNLLKIKKIVTI